jgi:hypothetical protein
MARFRFSFATALLLALGVLALGGCGSSSDSQGGSTDTATFPTARGGKAEREAPKGASPVLREIYRQFPPPKPNPVVEGSAAAIEAGEAACEGKTPLAVKAAFYAEAVEAGNLEAGSPQAKMIAKLPSYQRRAASDTSFVAGQLAAGVYQATLPERIAQFGYQGCIYSLARELKRELAPRK